MDAVISRTIVPSADLVEARDRFLAEMQRWIGDCLARYGDAPPTEVHDQATYTTAWAPAIAVSGDAAALAFLRRLRDDIRDHFTATGRWRHGYWTMQEAHHGTEHFELFLGALAVLAPDDATTAQLIDVAEHMGNWVSAVPPWFDWERGLFRSIHFGAEGVLAGPGLELNVPDHLRCAGICLLAHRASGQARFLDLATVYARTWADAILEGETLPVALGADGPRHAFSDEEAAHYRTVVGQALPNPTSAVDRAENLLASNAIGVFLSLWQATGEDRFRRAAERLLDILVTQLADPDAGVLAAAIGQYRRATGSRAYDPAVVQAGAALDPFGWETLTLVPDDRLTKRPSGLGKRKDMLRWLEDGKERRHSPILLALIAEITADQALACRALDIGHAYLALAREVLPDGRDHGCAARSVSAVARGHGRENHAGVVTAVLTPLQEQFAPPPAAGKAS